MQKDSALNAAPPADAASDDPDAALVRGMAAGDAAAFEQLMDRHMGRLHAAAWRLLDDRDEAEDVCQELFLQAWRGAGQWQPGRARYATWLHQVMLNGCRDRLRRRRPGLDLAAVELIDDGPGPHAMLATGERRQRLHQALAGLSSRQREAVVLCHFSGLPQQQVAAMLDMSVEALESLLRRARQQLRRSLLGEDGEAWESRA